LYVAGLRQLHSNSYEFNAGFRIDHHGTALALERLIPSRRKALHPECLPTVVSSWARPSLVKKQKL
jgi:hypothetical protein